MILNPYPNPNLFFLQVSHEFALNFNPSNPYCQGNFVFSFVSTVYKMRVCSVVYTDTSSCALIQNGQDIL